jgi:hypothetical protein
MHLVIIGNGITELRVLVVRRLQPAARITIVSSESKCTTPARTALDVRVT